MAVTPIDSTASTPASAEAKFNSAVDKSKEQITDEELTTALIDNAVMVGGQFIIMPKVQEILNEAMSSEDDEE
ncbi:hypothetical protein ACQKPE_11635 [Pseudomonas sp. NPDC089554]|uniref:hypothetical protein n=1 Tax=Pseudomonas sp. NPDC089554 TaxID=3390653 RepID=UPI003CFDFCD6